MFKKLEWELLKSHIMSVTRLMLSHGASSYTAVRYIREWTAFADRGGGGGSPVSVPVAFLVHSAVNRSNGI